MRYERPASRTVSSRKWLPLFFFLSAFFAIFLLFNVFDSGSAGFQEELSLDDPRSRAGDSLSARSPSDLMSSAFCLDDRVKRGDTFETILLRNGIDRDHLYPVLEAARDSHNLNRVVVGRQFRFSFVDSILAEVAYEIDEDRTLRITRTDSANWNADIEETLYDVHIGELADSIDSSLYETVMRSQGSPELALMLSEIYAWQIDFHNDIRKGDKFRVIYEEKVHPKGYKRIGKVLAAVFENDGQKLWAVRFTNANGLVDYFDLEGKSVRRAFLKSPFKYAPRVSSRFSYSRFHPILKIRRPHLGVDYAAPKGTPVLALGDGKVLKRSWNGGFGNYIQLKHNGMYSTAYGHLSGFAKGLKVGSWVRQGQVIGFVGSSGLATGPHLDFRFFKDNRPVDPLKVDVPPGDPVGQSVLSQFTQLRDYYLGRLELIGSGDSVPPLVQDWKGTSGGTGARDNSGG